MARLLAALLATGSAAVLSACGGDQGTLRLAHVLPSDHPVHISLERGARLLAERSGGRMRLQVIADGRYGTERQHLEKLKLGTLSLAKVSMAALEAFQPRAAVLCYPYLLRDEAHKWRVLEGEIGRELLDCALEQGFKGLCYMDAGWRSFYTRRGLPVRGPGDLRGLKIRCINSPTMLKAIAALGAAPTHIEWAELYGSLDQGLVDGAENNIPSLYSSRQYEKVGHYTLNRHMGVPDVVVMARPAWEALPPGDRELLLACFAEAAREQKRLWQERCARDLAAMRAAGLEVIDLGEGELAAFAALAEGFYAGLPPEMKDLAGRIRAVR